MTRTENHCKAQPRTEPPQPPSVLRHSVLSHSQLSNSGRLTESSEIASSTLPEMPHTPVFALLSVLSNLLQVANTQASESWITFRRAVTTGRSVQPIGMVGLQSVQDRQICQDRCSDCAMRDGRRNGGRTYMDPKYLYLGFGSSSATQRALPRPSELFRDAGSTCRETRLFEHGVAPLHGKRYTILQKSLSEIWIIADLRSTRTLLVASV